MKQNWVYKRLDEACRIEFGTRVVQKKDGGSTYDVYGGGGATFKMDRYNREDCFIVSRFAMSPKCTRYVKGKFFLNDSGLSVSTNIPDLSQAFVDSFLLANNDKIYAMGKGAAQRNLDMASFRKMNIPVPPMSEQSRIVAELDLLTGIIDKQKAQLTELDNLAQSIFYDMFGDPIENPKGWSIKKLGELSSLITNGNTPKGGEQVYVDKGILFLRSQNVWKNRIDYDDVAYIDDATNAVLKKSVLHHNDILITKTGRINTENSSLGRSALFDGETGTANINGHVYLVRLFDGISHTFVLRILISKAYREYIRKVCVGGIDKRQINKDHVEDFPIIVPPFSLQQEFADKITAIEKQKSAINQSMADTQKLLDYTMDKYFG